jgi:hypothetical protein
MDVPLPSLNRLGSLRSDCERAAQNVEESHQAVLLPSGVPRAR